MRLRKPKPPLVHVCRATITVRTCVNDGPVGPAGTFSVTDGSTLTIMQPVEVTFRACQPVRRDKGGEA